MNFRTFEIDLINCNYIRWKESEKMRRMRGENPEEIFISFQKMLSCN